MKKEIGYIGLGKMGFNMVQRLLDKGWDVHVYNRSYERSQEVEKLGGFAYKNIADLVAALPSPRFMWIMVPYTVVDTIMTDLLPLLNEGDYIIDGGNSPYKESIRRAQQANKIGVHYLDIGVSGGPDGARNGACLMVGGEKSSFDSCETLFQDISAQDAYGYMGNSGAGHFVKMVHNGIEYGMMQAIAEGFSIMKSSSFKLDLGEIARVYNHASVIESRLIGWMHKAYSEYGDDLEGITNMAIGTGEGKWTIEAAHDLGIPDHVIHDAYLAREMSQQNPNYQAQIIMALRNQFGGHDIK